MSQNILCHLKLVHIKRYLVKTCKLWLKLKVTLFKFPQKVWKKRCQKFVFNLVRLNFIHDEFGKRTDIFHFSTVLLNKYSSYSYEVSWKNVTMWVNNWTSNIFFDMWENLKYGIYTAAVLGNFFIDLMLIVDQKGRHLKHIIWMWCDFKNNVLYVKKHNFIIYKFAFVL